MWLLLPPVLHILPSSSHSTFTILILLSFPCQLSVILFPNPLVKQNVKKNAIRQLCTSRKTRGEWKREDGVRMEDIGDVKWLLILLSYFSGYTSWGKTTCLSSSLRPDNEQLLFRVHNPKSIICHCIEHLLGMVMQKREVCHALKASQYHWFR